MPRQYQIYELTGEGTRNLLGICEGSPPKEKDEIYFFDEESKVTKHYLVKKIERAMVRKNKLKTNNRVNIQQGSPTVLVEKIKSSLEKLFDERLKV